MLKYIQCRSTGAILRRIHHGEAPHLVRVRTITLGSGLVQERELLLHRSPQVVYHGLQEDLVAHFLTYLPVVSTYLPVSNFG